jgi:succinyl-diaminopimelate desuccinylase
MEFRRYIDAMKADLIKSTQESIRIKSVEESELPGMPFGKGNHEALSHFLKLGESMGFRSLNLDGYAGHLEMGDGEETVGILAHLDVVPEGDGWTYPPYGGEIHGGKLYGRGTTDDKGPAMAALYAMKAVKDSGISLKRKVRLILGLNEESGWRCMEHYFSKVEHPDMAFTPDAEFPVIHGEKGIIIFNLKYKLHQSEDCEVLIKELNGGIAPNMVPDSAKAVLSVKDKVLFKAAFDKFADEKNLPVTLTNLGDDMVIDARGISAHGSTPEKGENAITHLMSFLGTVYNGGCSMCSFIRIYNEILANNHHGESIGCGLEDDVSGKLNFNVGMITLKDNEIIITINVRYPIKSTAQEVYDGIRDNLKDTPILLAEGKSDSKPLYVPVDNFLVETLMKVYQEHTGDKESKPITIGGGTYARATQNAVAFGPMFPGQPDVAHQKDEYIAIEHLVDLADIYSKAIYQLASQ